MKTALGAAWMKQQKWVFYTTAGLIVLGATYDALLFWTSSNFSYQLSNGILALVSLVFLWVGFSNKKNIPVAMSVMVYATLANMIFVFFYNQIPGNFVTHLFRNSFLIPFLLITIGLVVSKYHVIIFGTLYFVFLILLAFFTNNCYLQHNLIFFLIILGGSIAGLYLFVTRINQLFKCNDSMHNETLRMQEAAFLEKESYEAQAEKTYQMVELVTTDLYHSLEHIQTSLDFLTKNEEFITNEVRKKYQEMVLNATRLSMEMMHKLTDFGTLQLPNRPFKRADYLLSDLLSESLKPLQVEAEKKVVRIKTRVQDQVLFVDHFTFTMALRVLLQLVIDYLHNGKSASTELIQKNGNVYLQITGKGPQQPLKNLDMFIMNHFHLLPDLNARENRPCFNYLFCNQLFNRNGSVLDFSIDLETEFKFLISLPIKE